MMGEPHPGAGAQQTEQTGPPQAWAHRFSRQFFKTRICNFWDKGTCNRGDTCNFAHGQHELQTMPDLTNTALCHQMVVHGKCDTPGCKFAHNIQALRATGKFYKTKMCTFYRLGKCRLGAQCRHAHSVSELHVAPQSHTQGETDRFGHDSYDSTWQKPSPVIVNLVEVFDPSPQYARVGSLPADWSTMGTNEDEDINERGVENARTWQRVKTVPASSSSEHLATGQSKIGHFGYDSSVEQLSTVAPDTDGEFDQNPLWARIKSTHSDLSARHAVGLKGGRRHAANIKGDGFDSPAAWQRAMTAPTISDYEHVDTDDEFDQCPAKPADLGPNHAMDLKQRYFDKPMPWQRVMTMPMFLDSEHVDTDDEFDEQPPWMRVTSTPAFTRKVSTPADLGQNQAQDPKKGCAGTPIASPSAVTAPVSSDSNYEHVDTDDEFDQDPPWPRMQSSPAILGPVAPAYMDAEHEGRPHSHDEINSVDLRWGRVQTLPAPVNQVSMVPVVCGSSAALALAPSVLAAPQAVGTAMQVPGVLVPFQAKGSQPLVALLAQGPDKKPDFEAKHLQRAMPRIDED